MINIVRIQLMNDVESHEKSAKQSTFLYSSKVYALHRFVPAPIPALVLLARLVYVIIYIR